MSAGVHVSPFWSNGQTEGSQPGIADFLCTKICQSVVHSLVYRSFYAMSIDQSLPTLNQFNSVGIFQPDTLLCDLLLKTNFKTIRNI